MSGNMTTSELLASFGLTERKSALDAVADLLREKRTTTASEAEALTGFSRKSVNDSLLTLVKSGRAAMGYKPHSRTPHYVWTGK